jgi:hypothetical protein
LTQTVRSVFWNVNVWGDLSCSKLKVTSVFANTEVTIRHIPKLRWGNFRSSLAIKMAAMFLFAHQYRQRGIIPTCSINILQLFMKMTNYRWCIDLVKILWAI